MMTNQEAIKILDNLKPGDYSNPYEKGEAIVMAISALQAQDSSVDLFPDLTEVEKAKIRGYVKGQLDAINDLVAAGLIKRGKAFSMLKDHDFDEIDGNTISKQATIAVLRKGEPMLKVPYGQDPYSVIGKYIRDHITAIEDIIAVIKINKVETNQLFTVDINEENYFIWENDWWEGEEDVTLIDFFPVSEAQRANQSVQSADTISRQAAIEAVEYITSSMSVCVNTDECHGMKRMQRQAIIELANLPPAQPEVTFCRECVHFHQGKPYSMCYRTPYPYIVNGDKDYCSFVNKRDI